LESPAYQNLPDEQSDLILQLLRASFDSLDDTVAVVKALLEKDAFKALIENPVYQNLPDERRDLINKILVISRPDRLDDAVAVVKALLEKEE